MANATFYPLAGSADTTNLNVYTSTSFTPTVGRLLVVLAMASGTVTAPGGLTSSVGLTFANVAQPNPVKATGGDTFYMFVANAATTNGAAQTVSLDVTGDTGTGYALFVGEVADFTATGAGAVRQWAGLSNGPTNSTTISFSSAPLTTNPVVGMIACARNPAAMTPPTGWTEAYDLGYDTPTQGAELAYRNGGHTSTAVTWGTTTSGSTGGIVVEFNSAVTATVNAGEDRTVEPFDPFTLTATSSEASVVWTQISGPTANPSGSGLTATVSKAPPSLSGAVLVYRATAAGSVSDDVQITVLPATDAYYNGTAWVPVRLKRIV